MINKYPNNNHKKLVSPARRKLLQVGIAGGVGGALFVAGRVSDSWWSSLFKPAPSPTLYTYAGHPSGISSVAWSPDGTRIASIGRGDDRTIQIWNASNGQHLLTYRGHSDAGNLAWSPDSTRIASVGSPFAIKVQVWNASNGEQLWIHQEDLGRPPNYMVAWSPDGRQIASDGNSDSGSIQIRNASDGQPFLNYEGHPYVSSLAWSPDGTRIVTGGVDRSVQVWRAEGRKIWFYEIADVKNEDINHINAVAWSPDSAYVASGGSCPIILFANNGGVQLWDASTGKKGRTYWGHDRRSDIRDVAWSPTGKLISSAATDKTVQVWDPSSGKMLLNYGEHTDELRSIAWSPDGTRIVSGGDDKLVRVWKVI